jgi:hypothetical protein
LVYARIIVTVKVSGHGIALRAKKSIYVLSKLRFFVLG